MSIATLYMHCVYSLFRVLYVSLHRYDYGLYYPSREDADPRFAGGKDAQGYNVNVAWNRDTMGDSEYLSAFHHIIMPIAYEVYMIMHVWHIILQFLNAIVAF